MSRLCVPWYPLDSIHSLKSLTDADRLTSTSSVEEDLLLSRVKEERNQDKETLRLSPLTSQVKLGFLGTWARARL